MPSPTSKWLAAALAAALAAGGCLAPLGIGDGAGFRCTRDEQCESELQCIEGHCRPPGWTSAAGDGGSNPDSAPGTDGGEDAGIDAGEDAGAGDTGTAADAGPADSGTAPGADAAAGDGGTDAGADAGAGDTGTDAGGDAGAGDTGTDAGSDIQPTFPIRAAAYAGWFPHGWSFGSKFTPSLGQYDSDDLALLQNHLAAMRYAHIQVGLFGWWGIGQDTEATLGNALEASVGTDFRWAAFVETEAEAPVTITGAKETLSHLATAFGAHTSYLRIGGRFVVFVHSAWDADPCAVSDRWVQANAQSAVPAYLVLRARINGGSSHMACARQPEAWFQFNENFSSVAQGDSISVCPGNWKAGATSPILARSLARFDTDVQQMVAAQPKFELVWSFNRWDQGTSVEGALEWTSDSGYGQYLDVLHAHPP